MTKVMYQQSRLLQIHEQQRQQMQYSIQQSSITKTQQIHCQDTEIAGKSH
jgi:hypothetical protein